MDFDVLILALVILMAVTVGAYVAKNELSPDQNLKWSKNIIILIFNKYLGLC